MGYFRTFTVALVGALVFLATPVSALDISLAEWNAASPVRVEGNAWTCRQGGAIGRRVACMPVATGSELGRYNRISRLIFQKGSGGNYVLDDILIPTAEQAAMPQQQYAWMADFDPYPLRRIRVNGLGVRSCLVDLLGRAWCVSNGREQAANLLVHNRMTKGSNPCLEFRMIRAGNDAVAMWDGNAVDAKNCRGRNYAFPG